MNRTPPTPTPHPADTGVVVPIKAGPTTRRHRLETLVFLCCFVLLPAFLGLEFRRVFRGQADQAARQAQQRESQDILNRVAMMGNPQKRFGELLQQLIRTSPTQKTLLIRAARLWTREKPALDLFVFDHQGKFLPIPGLPVPPKAAAEKFLRAVRRQGPAANPKILEAFAGNAAAADLMADSPSTLVDLRNGPRRTFGGHWQTRPASAASETHLIAFVHDGEIDRHRLLDRAVLEARHLLGETFSLGWWNPAVSFAASATTPTFPPPVLRPVAANFPAALAVFLSRLPPDRTFAVFDGQPLTTLIGEGGQMFFCLLPQQWRLPGGWADPRFRPFLITTLLLLAGLGLWWGLTGRFGVRLKLTFLFTFAGLIFLGTLLVMAFIDGKDRELLYLRKLEKDHLAILEKIDQEAISELLPLFQQYEEFVSQVQGKDLSEFPPRVPALREFLTPRQSLLEGLICVDRDGQEFLYMAGGNQRPEVSRSTHDLYFRMAMDVLKEFRGAADNAADAGAFMSKTLAQGVYWGLRTTGKVHHQKLVNQSVVTFSDLIRAPDQEPIAFLLAMHNSRMMQTRFLQRFSRSWRTSADFPSYFLAVPVHADARWEAFPRDTLRHEPVLKNLVSKVVSLQVPQHESGFIRDRRYYFSCIKGNLLEDYILIMARPWPDIQRYSQQLNYQLGFISLALLLLGLGTAFLTSRSLLEPLKEVGIGLDAIRARNFRTRVKAIGVEELERVGKQINHISDEFRDLQIARQVQEQLLPDKPLSGPGWEIAGACVCATNLGGDFHDWFLLPDGQLVFAIGDVAGHGIPAALVMALAKVELLMVARRTTDPAEMLAALHASFREQSGKVRPMAMWLGVFDPKNGNLRFSSGGHPYAFCHQEDRIDLLGQPAYPLGARRVARYQTATATIPAGGTVVLVSDGFIEAASPGHRSVLGYDRLGDWIRDIGPAASGELITRISRNIQVWSGRDIPEDDQTIVVLRTTSGIRREGTA